jgi:hypothetical protein
MTPNLKASIKHIGNPSKLEVKRIIFADLCILQDG